MQVAPNELDSLACIEVNLPFNCNSILPYAQEVYFYFAFTILYFMIDKFGYLFSF